MKKSELERTINNIAANSEYQKLKGFCHHGTVSRFDHCISVARLSWRIASLFGLNATEAVKGALLHDFYLYCNQHSKPMEHVRQHPKDALAMAEKHFELTEREKDIILFHMWPIAERRPAYPESYIVNIADTLCAVREYMINLKVLRNRNEEQRLSCPLPPQTPCEQGQ